MRLALDRVVAAGLLVLSAPAIGLLAALVWLEDHKTAFVPVLRMGEGGRTFSMWKLRSMRVDRPDGTADGSALTSMNDQRITHIGARMRRYHLDELPQLWNVARGEMCLFGPRPEAPAFVDLEDPCWQAVLRMPPGIAGPTQLVVGGWERHIISSCPDGTAYRDQVVPVKLAIDTWYMRRASLTLDLLTAATLFGRLVPTVDARRLRERVLAEVPAARSMGAGPSMDTKS